MKGSIRPVFLFLIYLILSTSPAWAQDGPGTPQYRNFPTEELNELRQNEDFQYERKEYATVPWWDSFTNWLVKLLKSLFGMAPSGQTILIIVYLICAVILVWVITRLVGVDINGVFQGPKEVKPLGYHLQDESIHQLDFPAEMEKARAEGKWRLLVRLQYLYALKQLADHGLLEVKNGKTNHDYLYEISSPVLRAPFGRLSRIFNYTWYGHFEASPKVREEAESELRNLQTHLQQ